MRARHVMKYHLICTMVWNMLLILDDNSEMGAHGRSNFPFLIGLGHLMKSRSVTIRIFPPEMTDFPLCVRNMFWFIIWYRYRVPNKGSGEDYTTFISVYWMQREYISDWMIYYCCCLCFLHWVEILLFLLVRPILIISFLSSTTPCPRSLVHFDIAYALCKIGQDFLET